MTASAIFRECVESVRRGDLIEREGPNDKEFHFQNWFQKRLTALGLNYDQPGRNTYPDFRLVNSADGYELKGLAYPGREANYDSNSQVPVGAHNGRTVYYVFGRYPKAPDGNRYPLLDLVMCHGDFLNADSEYVHKNKNFKGFGTYGDIMVRDRKMYVVPTPFALAEGTAHRMTLILPEGEQPGPGYFEVGRLVRHEVEEVVVSYEFDLRTNDLIARTAPNANAGKEHVFIAHRLVGESRDVVRLRSHKEVLEVLKDATGDDDTLDAAFVNEASD